jgi:protein phosphatase
VAVLRLVMNMIKAGTALCVPGNHDAKLLRYLRGSKVTVSHGLDRTVSQLEQEPPEFVAEVSAFLDSLVSHYILDEDKLVVAHAGLKAELQGRASGKVREFCLYGETTDENDEFGLPVRINWAEEYRGNALVVYGHSPIVEAQSCNNTICIDTGCVFGNKLTAYRYPEKELVDVPARQQYYAPVKPLNPEREENAATGATVATANIPDIADVLGKRWIETRFLRNIAITEESAASALEIMSRFSADPRWLIYLPPTMSPCGTSKLPDYLEHPLEAFDYFRKQGVEQVICERKHMGSRAVITLCRNHEVARARFGVDDGSSGIIYTRTGRHFFYDASQGRDPSEGRATETALLERLRSTLDASGFWEAFHTDWVCLDTELMPWSAKARELLVEQYAPVGRAGRDGIASVLEALRNASGALQEQAAQPASAIKPPASEPLLAKSPAFGLPASEPLASEPQNANLAALLNAYTQRAANLALYTEAYRRYCWQVSSIDNYRIAPFHILATEGKVWHNETHLEHLSVIQRYMTGAPIFTATEHLVVDPNDARSVAEGIDWWQTLTTAGGEGMVVKPLNFIARKAAELLQPAVKCRGREYLRIIYGPEYTDEQRLNRLRERSLGKKRRLALAEFVLGMEALERFVGKEPLHRVHECVFGILALENEAVDPRL